MSIRHWPTDEQPAVKLLNKGPGSLSDSELLSLLIRTGLPGKHAVDIVRDALTTFGSLRAFLTSHIEDFCAVNGLGESKYILFQAALELNRRYLFEEIKGRPVLSSPRATREFLASEIAHLPYEVFVCIFVDTQNRVITAHETLFKGDLASASIHPRQVVERVLYHNSSGVVISHQHPCGHNAEPSQADRHITERLKNALALFDCRLLDHIVISGTNSVSFSERGWL